LEGDFKASMTKRQKENIGMALEIEPDDLKERLDSGQDIYILDVRTPEEYQAWRISYDRYQNPPLIPIDQLFGLQTKTPEHIPKHKEIVTVCAHGNRSMMAAKLLSRLGYNVKSVRGGMSGWNAIYDIAKIHTKSDSIRIWQVRRVSKGCIGYLVASKYNNNAIAIDPTCQIDRTYIKLARENGLRITKVVDTHMHADHVSGASALAKSVSASLCVSLLEGYEVNNDHKDTGLANNNSSSIEWIRNGKKIEIGNGAELVAVHTPGHTYGSTSFSLTYDSSDEKYLFTGDTLFVDGVGRPDLKEDSKELASKLYSTYYGIFSESEHADDTTILPGHFNVNATSLMHGKAVSDKLGTIRQRITGSLPSSKKEFVGILLHNTPPKPANYKTIVEINRGLTPCDKMQITELEIGPNSCGISATKRLM
jgi:glyoxylase-like metal-dependent hydrolase (beta-lactamase superfamily II)/rhodanese-related sulfurtransferase